MWITGKSRYLFGSCKGRKKTVYQSVSLGRSRFMIPATVRVSTARFWKTWQGFNLKCGLWMALVWSKSEGIVSSQPRSLSKWGQSHDIMTSLALTYRQPLVHRRLQGNISQIGLESPRRQVHPSFLSLLIVAWVMFWSVCDRWECPHWQRGILPSTLPMQYRAYFLPGATVLPLSYLVFYKKYHLLSSQS